MPRGKVELTPSKKLTKAAELLGMDVVMLHTLLTVGQENVVNDEEIQKEYGTRFTDKVDAWNFLEGCV